MVDRFAQIIAEAGLNAVRSRAQGICQKIRSENRVGDAIKLIEACVAEVQSDAGFVILKRV